MNLSTETATDFLRSKIPPGFQTQVGIILGSGLGGLADKIQDPMPVDYESIPGFVRSTAGGHQGKLIFGSLESVNVLAMAGRFHRYEGWTNDQATFPVRVMHELGAERLIVSNAAGGVSPKLSVGDIVILRDHLNWMGGTFAMNDPHSELAPSHRPPASVLGGARRGELYDRGMADAAQRCAMAAGFNANFGTYLATLGPNYETRSEYRASTWWA
jgi:purine-nucleoside phosphorylase